MWSQHKRAANIILLTDLSNMEDHIWHGWKRFVLMFSSLNLKVQIQNLNLKTSLTTCQTSSAEEGHVTVYEQKPHNLFSEGRLSCWFLLHQIILILMLLMCYNCIATIFSLTPNMSNVQINARHCKYLFWYKQLNL